MKKEALSIWLCICFILFGSYFVNKAYHYYKHKPVVQESEINWQSYVAHVEKKIKKNWVPPKMDTKNHIMVSFKIHKNGEVSDLYILKSSKIQSVDSAALDAVRKAAPFDKLPKQFKGESIPIEFTFDYNVRTINK